MRKVLSVFCVLIAAALVFAGAVLPRISAAVVDRMNENKTGSAPIQTVALNLQDRAEQNSTPGENMLHKLAMEQHMYTVPIDPSEASMTEEEVYAAVESRMEDYVQAGIFEWFPYTYRMAEPILGIYADGISNMNIIWSVAYAYEEKPYQSLFIHIDDETGKILYLQYDNYGIVNTYPEKSPEYADRMNYILDSTSGIFFNQLGLSEVKENLDSNNLYNEGSVDGGVYRRVYPIADSEYGEISLVFRAEPSGFSATYRDDF
ncbi:MAG: hypothetical protein ACI3W5_12335 [Faecousia sp.]